MSFINCSCRCKCALAAIVAAVIIGVVTAFLQITAVITVTTAFLWVLFGIAVVYLGVLVVAASVSRRGDAGGCECSVLDAVLAGILGTILLSVILLAVGIVATSVISAILVGTLLGFFTLIVAGSACYVRSISGCDA